MKQQCNWVRVCVAVLDSAVTLKMRSKRPPQRLMRHVLNEWLNLCRWQLQHAFKVVANSHYDVSPGEEL